MTYREVLEQPLDKFYQHSFDNRKTNLLNMSHAHLSNCYWFSMFFQNDFMLREVNKQLEDIKNEKTRVVKAQDYEKAAELRDEEKSVMFIIDEIKTFQVDFDMNVNTTILYKRALDERFNGVVLPYSPHPDFEQEIKWLMQMKMLRTAVKGYDIVYNEIKIGQIDIL